MEVGDTNQNAELAGRVFCPICGDTMHTTTLLGVDYWECDDPTCGYLEPK